MSVTVELLPLDPAKETKRAIVTDQGGVICENQTFPTLVAFQNYLKSIRYMISYHEPDQKAD